MERLPDCWGMVFSANELLRSKSSCLSCRLLLRTRNKQVCDSTQVNTFLVINVQIGLRGYRKPPFCHTRPAVCVQTKVYRWWFIPIETSDIILLIPWLLLAQKAMKMMIIVVSSLIITVLSF